MILLYHKIYLESPSIWWVDVDNFYRQMYELRNKRIVFLDEYDYTDKNNVVITFDGVYENVLEYAAPILQKFNYPFELFVTGNYIGKDNRWDAEEPLAKFAGMNELKRLVDMGGRVQWHSKSHVNMQGMVEIDQIEDELSVPQSLLDIDPKGFKWFAFPHGNYSDKLLREVKKKFKGGLSCDQGQSNDRYRLERFIVTNDSKFLNTTVAVIIASYNYGPFLAEAIESVIRQTILPDEILITDDCSEDNTGEIAESYQKKFPKLIKYNRNEVTLGIVKHFNKAVSLTNSDYILFLGADNRLLSNYIEETKCVLDSSDDIGICYTDFALFGPRAKVVYNQFREHFNGEVKRKHFLINFPEWDERSKESLGERNFIHGSAMYKRKAYDRVGGYRENTVDTTAEDYDLFLRMVRNKWEAKKARRTFLEYRQHSRDQANIGRATSSELIFYKEKYKELLDEKQKLSRLLTYKILIGHSIIREAGFREFVRKAIIFLKEKLLG